MEVLKRDGRKEIVKLDKIVARIKKQTYGLNSEFIDPITVAAKVIQGLYDGVSTSELDNLAAETAAAMTGTHPDFSILAARIALSNLHKNIPKSFIEVTNNLYNYVNEKTGEKAGMIADDVYEFIKKNAKKLEEAIIHDRDFSYDYFGFKTLEKSYLLKIDKKIAETPQQMLMRVSCGIWKDDVNEAIKTYELMSQKFFTHATPTLFNAGTKRPQMSSCFLIQNEGDSIEGMFKSFADIAQISKNAGGIGININNIRAKGAYIKGTNGHSNGLIPFLKIMNEIARAIDQCFVPETKVLTKQGYKSIDSIEAGKDQVLTSSGEFKNVLETKKYPHDGKLVSILSDSKNIKVTEEHPFLVLRNASTDDRQTIIEGIKSGIFNLEWIDAKDIRKGDFIVKN